MAFGRYAPSPSLVINPPNTFSPCENILKPASTSLTMSKKPNSKSSSKLIAFKLNEKQLEPFKEGLAIAKSPSIYFKEFLIAQSHEKAITKIVKSTNEYAQFNFLLYKTSNNINQIAKVLNILAKSNFTDKAALYKALNNIHTLETTLKSKTL